MSLFYNLLSLHQFIHLLKEQLAFLEIYIFFECLDDEEVVEVF